MSEGWEYEMAGNDEDDGGNGVGDDDMGGVGDDDMGGVGDGDMGGVGDDVGAQQPI